MSLPNIHEDISIDTNCDGGEDQKDGSKVSDNRMLINLITTGLGAGILSMPWGVAGASIITAAVVNAVVLALNYFTIMLIIYEADRRQVFNIGTLLKEIPGRVGTVAMYITNFLVWFTMILCLISYMIVIFDSLQPLLPDSGIASERWFILSISMCAIFPCCFLDQKYLSFTSLLSVIMNIYIFIVVVYDLADNGPADNGEFCWLGLEKGSIAFFGAMMFTMVIQMCVLPMYEVMENRTPANFGKVMGQAFVFLFVLFSSFASLAYIRYGSTVPSDILAVDGGLPNNVMGNVGRMGMLLVVLGVFPLVFVPIIAPVTEWQNERQKVLMYDGDGPYESIDDGEYTPANESCCAMVLRKVLMPANFASIFVCVLVTFVAIYLKELGTMVLITGAISEIGFVGLAPCVIGLYLHPNKNNFWWKFGMVALLLFTCVMAGFGLALQKNYNQDLVDHCILQAPMVSHNHTAR